MTWSFYLYLYLTNNFTYSFSYGEIIVIIIKLNQWWSQVIINDGQKKLYYKHIQSLFVSTQVQRSSLKISSFLRISLAARNLNRKNEREHLFRERVIVIFRR